jgi:hypothetical protein
LLFREGFTKRDGEPLRSDKSAGEVPAEVCGGQLIMKNVLMFLLALVIVWVVWNIVMGLLAKILGTIISIGLILLFCFIVYNVYKALTREKLKY